MRRRKKTIKQNMHSDLIGCWKPITVISHGQCFQLTGSPTTHTHQPSCLRRSAVDRNKSIHRATGNQEKSGYTADQKTFLYALSKPCLHGGGQQASIFPTSHQLRLPIWKFWQKPDGPAHSVDCHATTSSVGCSMFQRPVWLEINTPSILYDRYRK